MAKLKVGDKVRFIENYYSNCVGDVVEVTGTWEECEGVNFIGIHGRGGAYSKRFELVEPKPTKNQRIIKLEERLDELELIVNKMRNPPTIVSDAVSKHVEDTIEFEGQTYRKVEREAREGDVVIVTAKTSSDVIYTGRPYKVDENKQIVDFDVYRNNYGLNRTPETVDVYELIKNEPTPKSLNQQRAEIIEKAKAFVECTKNAKGFITSREGYCYEQTKQKICDVEFNVNVEKYTVVSLLRHQMNQSVLSKGIARCHPNNVFNEHIGKAIALGRALGLDVTRFEQAVQPNEVVVCMGVHPKQDCGVTDEALITLKVTKKDGPVIWRENGRWLYEEDCLIINDTNAQYEGDSI